MRLVIVPGHLLENMLVRYERIHHTTAVKQIYIGFITIHCLNLTHITSIHNSCFLVCILIAFWMKKWFFSYENNDISCTHAKGHGTLRGNFEKMCNLVRLGEYFDQILYYIFLKGSLCIEQYEICGWVFRAFSLWINIKYRAILCVLVFISIESCVKICFKYLIS